MRTDLLSVLRINKIFKQRHVPIKKKYTIIETCELLKSFAVNNNRNYFINYEAPRPSLNQNSRYSFYVIATKTVYTQDEYQNNLLI